jgi:hypothetical protein
MIARMLAGLAIRLAFELFDNEMRHIWVIDLFAVAIHDPPATLDLEGEASQRTLVRDLRVMVFVGDPVGRVPPLVVGDVNDILHWIVTPQPLKRTRIGIM